MAEVGREEANVDGGEEEVVAAIPPRDSPEELAARDKVNETLAIYRARRSALEAEVRVCSCAHYKVIPYILSVVTSPHHGHQARPLPSSSGL